VPEADAMLMLLGLPHGYEVEHVIDLPDGMQPSFRYSAVNSARAGGDVLLLRFRPEGAEPWIGSFAAGTVDKNGTSMVLSSPDPSVAFVIAGGDGYSVRVDSPETWQMLPVSPVQFAEVLAEQGLVVLGSSNALAVYDLKGLCWFKRVVEDELKLRSIAEGRINFSGLDPVQGKTVTLSADLDTGNEVK